MALTVGELAATITLTTDGLTSGLRQAERSMQQAGRQMGDDAERAGQQAGEQLGGGFVRGADGEWRDLRGALVDAITAAALEADAQARRAGQQAGDQFGDSLGRAARQSGDDLADAVRRGGDDAADAAGRAGGESGENFLSRLRGRTSEGMGSLATNLRESFSAKLGFAALGAAAGAALMAGITSQMEQAKITGRLAAQLGKTPAEAQRYGHIAGQLYADAVTEDFQTAADVISAVMRAGIAPPEATEAQLESIATKVSDLASTFELDLGQTANAVGQMIKTGLAKDGTEAVDALTAGLQRMGPRADDIADTFNEYSTIFRQMGIDATTATGLLSQGMKAGARDTDVVADALKEFVLITQDGKAEAMAAFKSIGLNGKEMQRAFIEGGPKARKALDTVFDRLRAMPNKVDRNSAALALFGTKSEDTQRALMALDPSSASQALGEVGGAAERMGDALRDNAATRLESFKRNVQQKLVNFLGGTVVPGLQKAKDFVGHLWDDAGKGGAQGVDRVLAFVDLLGRRLVEKAQELAPKAIAMVEHLGERAAAYIAANPEKVMRVAAIAGAIVAAFAALPALVAAGLAGAALTMVLGFINKLALSTREHLEQWKASFGQWVAEKATSVAAYFDLLGTALGTWFSGLWSRYVSGPVGRTWNSFIGGVRQLPQRAAVALAALGAMITSRANSAWTSFRNASVQKATSFVSWVRGLPGMIGRAVGNLGSLLTGKGRDVVLGLWRGIQSMGGWLRSTLAGWARNLIPAPIAKALGIHSPSRVMAREVGRWIPAGVVEGIESGQSAVDASMRNLVSVPTTGQATASAVAAQSATARGASSPAAGEVVRIGSDGSAFGDFIINTLRRAVAAKGGDVQFAITGRA